MIVIFIHNMYAIQHTLRQITEVVRDVKVLPSIAVLPNITLH